MSKVERSNGMDLSWLGKPHEYDPGRLYSQTGADWQYPRRRRSAAQGAAGQAAGRDEEGRPRRAGPVRRRQHPLRHRVLPGQLEIQHQHPLRGRSGRRQADAVRDRRLRPAVREDRPAVDGRPHPSGHHLAVGGRRGPLHGRPHGRQRDGSAQGAQGREGKDRHRQPRHAGVRGLQEARPQHRQRLAGGVARARRQDPRRDRAAEAWRRASATRRCGRSSTSG